ncbi:DUF2442 domain-containing protein [Cognataquiflexum rubidum]|jgi:hypothetical protein|uniref:DUF2442 domain-containing protein n=1 Tax=Cognataquiflexum rubidum TaxID=2922273 RepID=UPI001F13F912|nr:DUF2442 domain-containing protein [Cognataquiflexum rubidum]MCH6235348.1 DUF2442 domain-containing protein [Cognataquiflexum rubidum]
MDRVRDLKVLQNYRIWIKFDDGEEKTINFRPFLTKGFSTELLDYDKFSGVFIEQGGGLAWENGYDFCPNYLKQLQSEEEPISK